MDITRNQIFSVFISLFLFLCEDLKILLYINRVILLGILLIILLMVSLNKKEASHKWAVNELMQRVSRLTKSSPQKMFEKHFLSILSIIMLRASQVFF